MLGTQVNKFEQVSSDGRQMSLAGVGPQVWHLGGGTLLRDLSHNVFDVAQPTPLDRKTREKTRENITFPTFRLRAVTSVTLKCNN